MGRLRMAPLLLWWSPVKYLAPAFVAIDVACLFGRGAPWRGVWTSTLDWPGAAMLLLGPVVAGVAAWRAVASNVGLGEAADVGGRAWVAQRAEATAVIGWTWLAHVVTLLIACTLSVTGGAKGLPDPLPLLPQFFIVVVYAALGVVAGNLVPNPLIAPLVTVATFYLVTQFSAGSVAELWVTVGGATASLAASHYNPTVLAAQTLWGLAAGLLLFAIHRTALGRLHVRSAVVVAALLPMVAIGAWLGSGPAQYLRDTALPALSCAGAQPAVCVLPGQESAARVLNSIWSRETAVAKVAGAVGLPTQMDQVDSATPLPAGHRAFSLEEIQAPDGGIDALNATFYLIIDRGRCMSGNTPPPANAIDRLQIAAEYLLLAAKIETRAQVADPVAAHLIDLPVDRQRAWLAHTLRAAAECAFRQIAKAPVVG